MPIAWDLLAALFRTPLRMQTYEITRGLERLEKWLSDRVKVAEALELRSRGFPIIGFYNEAVTLYVDESQRGALRRPPDRGVGETMVASGRAFVSGLSRVTQAVTEEMILPNLLARIVGVFDLIAESMGRFIPARSSMFDIRSRTASDLFGEVGLLFRAGVESIGPITNILYDAHEAREILRDALRTPGEAVAEAGAAASGTATEGDAAAANPATSVGMSLAEALDMGARFILTGILALPILPIWIGTLWRAASIYIRNAVLEAFQGIETMVFGIRRDIFNVFSRQLPSLIETAVRFLVGVWIVVELHWRFYIRVALTYGRDLIRSVDTFLHGLQGFLNYWITVINGIISAINAIENFDLAPIIAMIVLGPLVGGSLAGLGVLPRFTIGDMVGLGANVAREAFRAWLTAQILVVEGASGAVGLGGRAATYLGGPLGWWLGPKISSGADDVRFRVGAARRLVWRLLRAPSSLPAETAGMSLPASFPNVADAFFGPGAPNFGAALGRTGDALRTSVTAILNDGAGLLSGLSRTFDRSAADAASLGSPARMRRITEGAVSLADIAFGDQIRELQAHGHEDPIGAAFEHWLTRGGFYVVGSAIPLYVAELDTFWRAQVEEGTAESEVVTPPPTPTSPHILARRAVLGRVFVPEISVNAPGQPPGTDLAGQVATRLKTAIEESYVTGRQRLAELAAVPD